MNNINILPKRKLAKTITQYPHKGGKKNHSFLHQFCALKKLYHVLISSTSSPQHKKIYYLLIANAQFAFICSQPGLKSLNPHGMDKGSCLTFYHQTHPKPWSQLSFSFLFFFFFTREIVLWASHPNIIAFSKPNNGKYDNRLLI